MKTTTTPSQSLAAAITRAASKQSYFTIRLLADRDRMYDALRAYAYFRWVDDCVDADTLSPTEKAAFLHRQQSLLEACYRGESPPIQRPQEAMLVDLIARDHQENSGLQIYLRDMMAVMAFDLERRGRLISAAELADYSRLLATAVTENLHYFIGAKCLSPRGESRYLAVRAAHLVHMLRDTVEDVAAGYYNLPREYLEAHDFSIEDINSPAYRKWVEERVNLARSYFEQGRQHIAETKSLRCRLAGFAYTARFEWMLRAITRDGYRLRASYPERKGLRAGLWMLWRAISSLLGSPRRGIETRRQTSPRRNLRVDEA